MPSLVGSEMCIRDRGRGLRRRMENVCVFQTGFQAVNQHVPPLPDHMVWKSIIPCEWRIAIPASLMRVDKRTGPKMVLILLMFWYFRVTYRAKLPFRVLFYRDPIKKVIKDHPSNLGLAGGEARSLPSASRAVVPAVPSKSQVAGMVFDDFSSGIRMDCLLYTSPSPRD